MAELSGKLPSEVMDTLCPSVNKESVSSVNSKLIKEEQLSTKEPGELLEHLNEKNKLKKEMYQAAKDVLRLCDDSRPFEEMDSNDTDQITKIALPLLQYLEEIEK